MRYALGLEYDGAEFCGWQRQTHSPSVQQSVEGALSTVADHALTVTCAGRTDTGVHASGQVVHFDSGARRSGRQWLLGLNSNLPTSVRGLWIRAVDDDFHARFSAFSRSYRYSIMNRWIRPAIGARYYGWCRVPLDAERMHEAAQLLGGRHDFSAFRSAGCSAQHAEREILDIAVRRRGDIIEIDVTANAFLYHMVRNIAGSLIMVGSGEKTPAWLAQVLRGRNRKAAGVTAEPQGLCLRAVRYGPACGLPATAAAFPDPGRDS